MKININKKIVEYLYIEALNIENNVDTSYQSYQLNRIVYSLKKLCHL